MSGSGAGGVGYEDDEIDCEKLVFDTQISSPKEDVVSKLEEGDVLEVRLENIDTTMVVVVRHNGKIAGGLASPALKRLRECMVQGTIYKALVLQVDDGQVRVRVSAV